MTAEMIMVYDTLHWKTLKNCINSFKKHLRQFIIPAANSQSSLKWAPY